ncbi:MAG: cobalamin B12-binding domain-containing protein [Alphaproteobacteria bacterium]|nr:cobalamin B12-binding domain-containing protein [Alphaproteobacteria bacterium]
MSAAIRDLLHSGIPSDDILEFYIPEAARRFGEAWCSDGLSFADVTIAVARLQRSLREIVETPRDRTGRRKVAHSVLVIVVPDEYHTLGAMVMTEQFRRAGISVRLRLGDNLNETLRAVAHGQFDAIFLSAGGTEKLDHVRDLVEKTRRAAAKPTPIVVGGAVMTSGLDIKKLTGADHSTTDPRHALQLCGLKISNPGAAQRVRSG